MNKNYLYLAIVAVIIGVVFFSLANRSDQPENIAVSPSSTSTATSMPSPTSKLTNSSPKPTPVLVVQEVKNYKYLVDLLDSQNRRLALDENCLSVVPSQVEYPNDTEIMLDNTASARPRIIKIAGREYSLDANGWILTTLHSDKLPAQLSVNCGDMELGRLDLTVK